MGRADASTMKFDQGMWAPPVETAADLWPLAPEGQFCFVQDENQVYERVEDGWKATGFGMPSADSPLAPKPTE